MDGKRWKGKGVKKKKKSAFRGFNVLLSPQCFTPFFFFAYICHDHREKKKRDKKETS
jgi:hypothetical protein